jgi:predicted regulator of Ras-like GTPase activity (Roadblock/LC7/MglB family)
MRYGQGTRLGILAEMPDNTPSASVSDLAAEGALAFLTEMSADLRGAAILGPDGSVLAASGDPERWAAPAAALLAAADEADEEPVEQIHVASENGEVFALRHAGLVAIAVTDRFVLSSLMAFDMRAVMRRLADSAQQAA